MLAILYFIIIIIMMNYYTQSPYQLSNQVFVTQNMTIIDNFDGKSIKQYLKMKRNDPQFMSMSFIEQFNEVQMKKISFCRDGIFKQMKENKISFCENLENLGDKSDCYICKTNKMWTNLIGDLSIMNQKEKIGWYCGGAFELIFGLYLLLSFKDYQYKFIAISLLTHATFLYQGFIQNMIVVIKGDLDVKIYDPLSLLIFLQP